MAFTPIEWMALIVIVVFVVKMLVLLTKPEKWVEVVELVYSKPIITMIVALVLGYFTLTYLREAGIGIVQIFAVFLFIMFLGALSMSAYSKDMMALGRRLLRDKKVLKKAWLAVLVWVILSLWALKEIFNISF